jgi:flagellar basal-body rod modification protein FlgD
MTAPVTNDTTNTPNTSNTANSTTNSRTSLATNFQTFLTLLTTQLQNQDPTSPMDSNEFTQQLVMYSQVEQQIDTNAKLDSLVALSANQTTNLAMSYLGKNIIMSDGTGQLMGGSCTWTYGLGTPAANTALTIKDAQGNVVFSKTVDPKDNTAGTHDFKWDGTTNSGDTAPNGLYTLVISAITEDGKAVTTSVASRAGVTGVDLSGSSPQLVLGTGEVPLSSATLVTYPVAISDDGNDSSDGDGDSDSGDSGGSGASDSSSDTSKTN